MSTKEKVFFYTNTKIALHSVAYFCALSSNLNSLLMARMKMQFLGNIFIGLFFVFSFVFYSSIVIRDVDRIGNFVDFNKIYVIFIEKMKKLQNYVNILFGSSPRK